MPSYRWKGLDPNLVSFCNFSSVRAPSSCYDANDTVVVRVKDGSNTKEYTIMRKLLVWHSSSFATAMDPAGEFATNGSDVLDIECSHAVFDIFQCWINTGWLKDPPAWEPPAAVAAKVYFPKMKAMYDTWIFADRYGIPLLGNTVIDTLHERLAGSGIDAMPINMEYLYANTEPDSKLRQFVLAWYELTLNFSDLTTYAGRIKPTDEFLLDVYPLLGNRLWAERPENPDEAMLTSMNRCLWHDHSGPVGKLQVADEPWE
jgi:hypothetical protein